MKTDSAVVAEIDGQLVALDVAAGICYGLNRVATEIWSMIDQPISVAELTQTLAGKYDVELDVCREQTLDLLNDLLSSGMIVARSAP